MTRGWSATPSSPASCLQLLLNTGTTHSQAAGLWSPVSSLDIVSVNVLVYYTELHGTSQYTVVLHNVINRKLHTLS